MARISAKIRKEYVSVNQSLRKRRLDFTKDQLVITDEKTVQTLMSAVKAGTNERASQCIVLLGRVQGHDFSDLLLPLLDHEEVEVRIMALQLLGKTNRIEHAARIQRLFTDTAESVQAAAIAAYGAWQTSHAGGPPFLEHKSPTVRAAAITTLIRHGGLDGNLPAQTTSKTRLRRGRWRFVAATIQDMA